MTSLAQMILGFIYTTFVNLDITINFRNNNLKYVLSITDLLIFKNK